MNIYNDKDLEEFDKNIKKIIKKAKVQSLAVFEPSKKDTEKIQKIILDYVKEKKRKIYGGYALNEIIRSKNKDDVFYDDDTDLADIDIYSNDPINDICNVCDILADKGYKRVVGQEAQHEGTYSVFWEFINVLDVSYVPTNIYHKIPFEKINDIIFTHPSFIKIDSFRMFTDPFYFEQRLEKQFKRFQIVEKYYSMKIINKPLIINNNKIDDKIIINILDEIHNFVVNNSSLILFDSFCYNYYVEQSNITKKNKNIKTINTNNFMMISTDFKNDCNSICKLLKKKFNNSNNITKIEQFPFFQFYGRSMTMFYNDTPVLFIFDNDNKCIPFQQINPIKFHKTEKNKKYDKNDFIHIATFDFTLLMSMIMWIKHRVIESKDLMYYYKTMSSHLVQMKHNYFKINNNKTIFDDTPFEEFIVNCKGKPFNPIRDTRIKREKKRLEKKKIIWRYDPLENRDRPNYIFPNISGNTIKNNNFLIIDC